MGAFSLAGSDVVSSASVSCVDWADIGADGSNAGETVLRLLTDGDCSRGSLVAAIAAAIVVIVNSSP